MKKNRVRAVVLALTACLMLVCFSGCTSIDEHRARHAVWGDENQNSILWKGEEYVYLYQETNEETPYSPMYDWGNYIYVTEPDVPTLLASEYGFWADASVHGNYLSCNSRVFCKADQYDALKPIIDAGLPTDQYGYTYFDYEAGEETVHIFTREESRQLADIMEETVAGNVVDDETDWWYVTELYYCCEDTELTQYTGIDFLQSEQGYYLSCAVEVEPPTEEELKEMYGEDWEDVDWVEEEWVTCKIPAKYNELIEEWFAPILEYGW